MRKKWPWLVACGVLLLLGVLALPLRFVGTGSLPEGLIPAPGTYDVEILRDTWGVPHVFGRTDADVAYGLAWAQAEDDFATLQGVLLASRGRLASELGKDMAPNDYMVALLRVDEVVREGYPTLPEDVRALVDAYADGINHYAALHADEAMASLYPVTGEDLVRGFVHKVPLFFGIDGVLKELFEDERARSVSSPRSASLVGSNTFAVAPHRTADGSTFLAINSHQPWEGPVAWYEAHLRSDEGWDTVGGTFPGAPLILHGHNRHLGWAHTVNKPDLLDVYVLDIDPENPLRYRFDGQWRELEERTVEIDVKLFGPVRWVAKRKVHWSIHGPVVVRPHGTYALRYAGFGEVRHIEQWYRMNKATDFESWRSAMALGALPMFNTGYADADGNIHYVYNGQLPVRRDGWDYREYLPGDTSETLWRKTLPYDALPQVTNPPSGFLQNANSDPFHTVVGEGNPLRSEYASTFGIESRMTNRALRLRELFGPDPEITWDEFVDYKFDLQYSTESHLAHLYDRLMVLREAAEPELESAFEVLDAWDLSTDADNPHAALALLTLGRYLEPETEPKDDVALLVDLEGAVEVLETHHGSLEVPWGQVNRLRRGAVDLPVGGGPDIVHAIYGQLGDDGRYTGWAGDSYILLVAWDSDGAVRSESIHQYGSATLDETSPHYADQAPLFVERQLRPVWLDEAEIRANLGRVYRPGE